MRKKLAVMMAAMAATAMVGGCGAKDAAPTGAETKPAETSAAQETEAAQKETKEADAHEAEYLAEFFDVQIKEDPDSAAFSADLKKVAGDEAPAVEGDMTWFSAVKAAVAAADSGRPAGGAPPPPGRGHAGDGGPACAGPGRPGRNRHRLFLWLRLRPGGVFLPVSASLRRRHSQPAPSA